MIDICILNFSASGPSSPEDKGDINPLNANPMMQLFYGQYLAEGVNEGGYGPSLFFITNHDNYSGILKYICSETHNHLPIRSDATG